MRSTAKRPPSAIWRVKPMDLILQQGGDHEHGLKRTLGPISLTAMGVGAIVGTGIFVLTGVGAAKYAGPGLILFDHPHDIFPPLSKCPIPMLSL